VFSIRELFRFYSVTPVLCTATQPVLTRTEQFDFDFKEGFESVEEIIDEPDGFTEQLKRVDIELFSGVLDPVSYQKLAKAIITENQSTLCIVNRKNDCRELARLLPEEQTIHLSTNMCAAHRFETLKEIRQRLKTDEKAIYVVSTSLVEAGVDLDFPVVYRALTGLDSIAQAAGRCNREGILQENGKTVVFEPEKQPRYVQQSAGIARELLDSDLSNLFSPEKYKEYFSQRFWQLGTEALDQYGVLRLLSGRMDYYFRTAAEYFRFIKDDWQTPVIVPFGDARELIDRMISEPWRNHFYPRKLQRFTISIETRLYNKLVEQDYIHEEKKYPGVFTLSPLLYNGQFGFLSPDEIAGYDPESTIV
jgi:CRISPR-associated endonuclease/helicase Cas3